MTTIKQMANDYISQEIKTVDQAGIISVDLETIEKVFNEGKQDEFSAIITEIDGVEYRVPKTVLKQLKQLLTDDDSFDKFKVIKSGTGKNTTYQVVPK